MTVVFSVQFNEQPDFNYIIQELQTPLVNRVFKSFGSYRRSRVAQQFAKEVDPYGTKQTPLSENYRIWKEKKVGRRSILTFTGKMRSSYGQRFVGLQYTEYFDSDIAVYHQYGTSRLPARPMLPTSDRGLSASDQDKLLQLVDQEISRAWRRFGKPPTLQEIAQVTAEDVESVLSEIASYANRG